MQSLKNKKILITGGTGSLGQALVSRLLKENVKIIRIFSRNESLQVSMQSKFSDKRLRFLLGDIRDLPRLNRALEGIDVVIHTAALKHVPVIEYNPFEAINTNIIGSSNVIEASINQGVKTVVGISTDKAVSPLNTYGATKLLTEKLFLTASNYIDKKKYKTKFLVIRYGNVLGSSGSVIPKFIDEIKKNKSISITDSKMTRFSITMDEALDFIISSIEMSNGNEVFVPKLKAYAVDDIRKVMKKIYGEIKIKKIPIREGEKLHEILINRDEFRYAIETKDRFVIINQDYPINKINYEYKRTRINQDYSSEDGEKLNLDDFYKLVLENSNE